MSVSADPRLDDLGHALHPLLEAAFGPVGRVEDVGEVLKPVSGGAKDGREGGGVKLCGKIAVPLSPCPASPSDPVADASLRAHHSSRSGGGRPSRAAAVRDAD